MIISREREWVVITPPKTGSTTLGRLLTLPQFGASLWFEDWQHNAAIPEWAAGFRVYLSVRNPYARASSLWRGEIRDAWIDQPHASFAEFCRCLQAGALPPFYSQRLTDWWPGEATALRLEHLASDLVQLGPKAPFITPHENADPRLVPWTEPYLRWPEAWDIVAEWARADCDRFGYDRSPAG